MINGIPKARITFADGHTEDSVVVFLFSNRKYVVVTQTGTYLVEPYKTEFMTFQSIRKYHPEYAEAKIGLSETAFDLDGCWFIDENAEEVKVWIEPENNINKIRRMK